MTSRDQDPAYIARIWPHAPSQRKLGSKYPLAQGESWVQLSLGMGLGGAAVSMLSTYAIALPTRR